MEVERKPLFTASEYIVAEILIRVTEILTARENIMRNCLMNDLATAQRHYLDEINKAKSICDLLSCLNLGREKIIKIKKFRNELNNGYVKYAENIKDIYTKSDEICEKICTFIRESDLAKLYTYKPGWKTNLMQRT